MSKTDTQTTQAEAVVTPDDAIKGAFAEVIAGEQQAKAKLRVTQAKIAEYEAPLVDIRKMVATAEANVIQAEKLGDTMKKVPGGDKLHAQFVSTAKQGVEQAKQALADAQSALPGDYQDFRSIEASEQMALEEAEAKTAEARAKVVEYLAGTKSAEELAELAADAFLGKVPSFKANGAPRTRTTGGVPHPSQVSGVIHNGTEYPAVVSDSGKISFPGLKEGLIAAGVPESAWTEHGKTTTYRVAVANGAEAKLK
jgi:hypothetical protein